MAEDEKLQKSTDAKIDDEGKKPPASPARGQHSPAQQGTDGERRFEGFLAEVVGVEHNRTGIYGEIKQAMCKIMEGRDKGRVIRRNFAGRIKKGDLIRLPDTTREDKRIIAR